MRHAFFHDCFTGQIDHLMGFQPLSSYVDAFDDKLAPSYFSHRPRISKSHIVISMETFSIFQSCDALASQ